MIRLQLAHTSRILGLVLVHLIATGVGMMEYFKDRVRVNRNSAL